MTRRLSTYRHPEGKRYCAVVVGPNGRIKPDWVMGNDRQEKHLEKRWIESPALFYASSAMGTKFDRICIR